MKVNYEAWLRAAEHELSSAGIGTARLDVLVLLEDVTGKNRAWILAHPETTINSAKMPKLKNLLNMRKRHMPLAYVRGKTEFYGREFFISPAVLEPRPESETMIDILKSISRLPSPVHISDVGTGSGALGITASLELKNAQVELLDIDAKALKVAKTNVDKFTLSIIARKSDLILGSRNNSHVLLCNLPYVPDNFKINMAAMAEPKIAIFGGSDGLNLYRRLFEQVAELSIKPLYILCEAMPPQHKTLQAIAKRCGYQLIESQDFIQLFAPQK